MTTTGTLDQVICASAQATAALTERDNLIRKALTEGHTLRAVGQAAGLTHQGVAKIRDRGSQ